MYATPFISPPDLKPPVRTAGAAHPSDYIGFSASLEIINLLPLALASFNRPQHKKLSWHEDRFTCAGGFLRKLFRVDVLALPQKIR
eukprot:758472-Hanusia_phi.AAC.4